MKNVQVPPQIRTKTPPFVLSIIATAVFLVLSGCATVADGARTAIGAYCSVPTAARAVNRVIVNAAIVPNRIRVACAADDVAGVVVGEAVGDLVVTSADVAAAAPVVKQAKAAVSAYCALDETARQVNRATIAEAVAPNRVFIECAPDAIPH